MKTQLLHDYLVKTKLVREDQLNVIALSRHVSGINDWDLDKKHKRVTIETVITITDFAFISHDIDLLEYGIKYWLNRYNNTTEFLLVPEIKTSETVDLWIGDIEIKEESNISETGVIQRCYDHAETINNKIIADFKVFLKRVGSDEQKQIYPR